MEEIINYFMANYKWILPMLVSLLGFTICFFKKGKVTSEDVAKIMATEQIIASALTVMLENNKEELKHEETSSETKR